jgi:hypothetical protein
MDRIHFHWSKEAHLREPTTDDGVEMKGAENGGLRLELGRQLA